jgi:Ca2+-binding EF-hand superfamily protein
MSRGLLIAMLGGALLGGCGSCKKDEAPKAKTEESAAPARDVPSTSAAPRRNVPPRMQPGELKRPPSPAGTMAERRPSQLSDEERASMIEERRALRDERRTETLERFDADKDGKLSEDERAVMRKTRAEERFAELDADGDGMLSEAELVDPQVGRRRMPVDFVTADTNGDGKLTSDELAVGLQKNRAQMRRRIEDLNADGQSNAPASDR